MTKTDEPVTIKKYANRRLYNTGTSTYVTLEDLAAMVKKGEDFVVYDAKTGEDITRSVLTQIIFEQENKEGQNLLPITFLRQLIRFYGDSMQMLVPRYLEVSIEFAHPRAGEVPRADGAGLRRRRLSARWKSRCAGTWKCSSAPSRCSRRSPGARRRRARLPRRAGQAGRPRRRHRRPQAAARGDAEEGRPAEREGRRRQLSYFPLIPATAGIQWQTRRK